MSEKRKFKCRNGSILVEAMDCESVEINGFIDDYAVLISGQQEDKRDGDHICLLLLGDGFPIGGGWGSGWDIVEELVDE